MKKITTILLALILVLSIPTTAFAAEVVIPSVPNPDLIAPRATLAISFNYIAAGTYKQSTERYTLQPGESILHVTSCTWSPGSQKIFVGFKNIDTGTIYGVYFSGGETDPVDITTANLPDGEYYVAVKNAGSTNVTGVLRYWVE